MDPERIREEGMGTEEVLDRHTAEPQREVEWLPEWDEEPETQPGENARIEDGTLIWENGDFVARLESHETTHWRAEIEIPEAVGDLHPRPVDLKCRPLPEYGYVDSVTIEDYTTTAAVLIIQANFQPVREVNTFIDKLRADAEESQQFMDDLEVALDAARQNED